MSLSVKEILNLGMRQLEGCGVKDAATDSRTLYCYLTNVPPGRLILEYRNILGDDMCERYFKLLDRRCAGEPVQYITGVQEFMGLPFKVDSRVMIPRQDTEILAEDAISIIGKNQLRGEAFPVKAKRGYEILDLCCGCGAIGISLASYCAGAKVICSDISGEALCVARENAKNLLGGKRVEFRRGDLLAPFMGKFFSRRFDMIISNPPYIKSNVIMTLQREIRDHEPMLALDGGVSGLVFYEKIIRQAPKFLKKEGILMFEIGFDQKEEVVDMLKKTGRFRNITALKDLAGLDRVVIAVLSGKKKAP